MSASPGWTEATCLQWVLSVPARGQDRKRVYEELARAASLDLDARDLGSAPPGQAPELDLSSLADYAAATTAELTRLLDSLVRASWLWHAPMARP